MYHRVTHAVVAALLGLGPMLGLLAGVDRDGSEARGATAPVEATKAATGAMERTSGASERKPAASERKPAASERKSERKSASSERKSTKPPRPKLRAGINERQMSHAVTIVETGQEMGLPRRAYVVAIATAMQESELRVLANVNVPHSFDYSPRDGYGQDHDSVGLFQQRPSQGWGTEEQVSDPRYAAERFYRALSEVPGWQEMRVTEAAQRVQRSAFPEAYQQWAEDAGVLAAALLGQIGAAVACRVRDEPASRGAAAAESLGSALFADWGERSEVAPAEPAGVSVAARDRATGWQYAHWLVAHALAHGVTRVHFEDLEWTAERGDWAPADRRIDHVLAEVAPALAAPAG